MTSHVLRLIASGAAWALLAAPAGAPPAGGAAAAAPLTVAGAGAPAACVGHRPAPDVAFVPGRGVGGRVVAPADLAPPVPTPVDDAVAIDLELRLGDRLPGAAAIGLDRSAIPLGRIAAGAGGATWEGRPLVPPPCPAGPPDRLRR